MKQGENNDVSGLTNLARNIGASCGTAFVATMLTRRTAAHENSAIRNLVPGIPGFDRQRAEHGEGVQAGKWSGRAQWPFGGASLGAIHQAQASIYNQLHAQAATLAYVDIVRYLTIFCACMLPLLFFIPKAPKNMSVGH